MRKTPIFCYRLIIENYTGHALLFIYGKNKADANAKAINIYSKEIGNNKYELKREKDES